MHMLSLFTFPQDKALFQAAYWSLSETAAAWHCSYTAARNYVMRNPDIADRVMIVTPRGSSWRWAVPIGTARPAKRRGNPCFLSRSWQRDMVIRRWDAERRRRIFTPRPGYGVYRHGVQVLSPLAMARQAREQQAARAVAKPRQEFQRTPPSKRLGD